MYINVLHRLRLLGEYLSTLSTVHWWSYDTGMDGASPLNLATAHIKGKWSSIFVETVVSVVGGQANSASYLINLLCWITEMKVNLFHIFQSVLLVFLVVSNWSTREVGGTLARRDKQRSFYFNSICCLLNEIAKRLVVLFIAIFNRPVGLAFMDMDLGWCNCRQSMFNYVWEINDIFKEEMNVQIDFMLISYFPKNS